MAGRIRTLKPEWLEDEKLAGATDAARLLSVTLLLMADDYGNGRASLSHLASAGWGAHVERSIEENAGDARELFRRVAGALQELVNIRFVTLYEVRGQAYFSVRNWSRHQNVRRPGKPRVPGPEEADAAPSTPPLDTPTAGTPSGKSPASRGTDLRSPTSDLRSPSDERDACVRDPDHRPADRPPPAGRSPAHGTAEVVSLAERRAPTPPSKLEPGALADRVRAELLDGYRQRFEGELADAWMGASAAGQHVTTVAAWVVERSARTGEDPGAVIDRVLEGYFGREDLRAKRWPWRWLAEDPGRYAAAAVGTSTADIEAALQAEYDALEAREADARSLVDEVAYQRELADVQAAKAELRHRWRIAIPDDEAFR